MSREDNTFVKSILFKPSIVRRMASSNARVENITLEGRVDQTQPETVAENFLNTGSFRFDPPGFPLKSTQQLNVDWSKWEQHTFFNSAQVKVQTAFDKIINNFPFDGTHEEHTTFIDGLDGFTKHVLDIFPKSRGCLKFDRAYGSYISIVDAQGASMLQGAKGAKGVHVLNFNSKPFTMEVHVYVPSGTLNDNEIIIQKIAGTKKGITLALSASKGTKSPLGKAPVTAYYTSGNTAISASVSITKGRFSQVSTAYDRTGDGRLYMYVDGVFHASSSKSAFFDDVGNLSSPITIGTGTLHGLPDQVNFLPALTLSGALDELRMFSTRRPQKQIRYFSNRRLYADTEGKLRLYFKFNEPSGTFGDETRTGNEALVLDYSGNGLHTNITNFNMDLRNTGSLPNALSADDMSMSPVLFPSFKGVTDLGSELLSSASQYDYNNPNLITNLVPKHYFLEASDAEGFESEFGDINENYGYTTDIPGRGKMRSPQIIAALLYTWAQSFDEIKMFIDEFGRLLKVDYLSEQTITDQFLPFLARYYGINLPSSYATATLSQLLDGQDIRIDNVKAVRGLQGIQNILWRRVLSDLPELVQSRGTRHCVETIFRNLGINPNGPFRIREYGGSRTQSISDSYEKRNKLAAMVNFSGSLASPGTIDLSGYDSNRPIIRSHFLSASRTAPGKPEPRGTFIKGVSNAVGDGLFTSGSWTVEGMFKFDGSVKHAMTQSLFRLQTTGSRGTSKTLTNNWVIFNATAISGTTAGVTGSVGLYGRPLGSTTGSLFQLHLTGVNVFDGHKWHISFGRTRNDEAGTYNSSSYFLRAGQMGVSNIRKYHVTSAYYNDYGNNILNTVSASTNASGAFVVVGSQSLIYDSALSAGGFLNTHSDRRANYVDFSGKVSGIRFYSKALTDKETKAHVRNYKSVGTEDPLKNFNFTPNTTGSFERLRVDYSSDQVITQSTATGHLQLFDFSQNSAHASGSGFEPSKKVMSTERFDYLILSPRFELAPDPNKVRIRSFKQEQNLLQYGLGLDNVAPQYTIPPDEESKDDRRFSIEISSAQALNDDIMNIFATLDSLDNMLGDPELVFSYEYRDLRNLRRIYFNRLNEKMSLTTFFQFFQWFDATVGDLIEEFVPYTTRYLGTNFVVESHALERAKFTYNYSDMYVGILDRRESSIISMQQLAGSFRKF